MNITHARTKAAVHVTLAVVLGKIVKAHTIDDADPHQKMGKANDRRVFVRVCGVV
jgi:hypothetical protein